MLEHRVLTTTHQLVKDVQQNMEILKSASGIANKGDLQLMRLTHGRVLHNGIRRLQVINLQRGVTYDGGTVDEVPVTVKVQPQADYDPQEAQPVSVDHGLQMRTVLLTGHSGTTYDWKTPIDTSTPGIKPGTVVVTYLEPKMKSLSPVTVGEAALYTPVGQDVPTW